MDFTHKGCSATHISRCRNVLPNAHPSSGSNVSFTSIQKHGTTSKPLKAVKLDSEEQAKIAKSGLEMKMMSSEMDAETDKWQGAAADENNDIVKRYSFLTILSYTNLAEPFAFEIMWVIQNRWFHVLRLKAARKYLLLE